MLSAQPTRMVCQQGEKPCVSVARLGSGAVGFTNVRRLELVWDFFELKIPDKRLAAFISKSELVY